MKHRIFGELECIHKEGNPSGVGVVLLHGYGANAEDLYPLHEIVQENANLSWFFPQAPIELQNFGNMQSRAWFPITLADSFLQAVETGNWNKVVQLNPKGLDSARELLVHFLSKLPIPYSKIILGGFSQGAMLALDTFLNIEEKPAGLVLLSGTILKEKLWKELAERKKGFSYFQSHGMVDDLLPFPAAKRLDGVLQLAGMKGEFVPFPGGHGIPDIVLRKLAAYIQFRIPV